MIQQGVFVTPENIEVVTMADVKQILLNILNSPSLQDCTQQECYSSIKSRQV